MNDILKQDIFFFITAIAVIVVTVLLAILIIYLIKISRDVKHIADKAKTETDLITEDLDELRKNVKKDGFRLKQIGKFVSNIYKRNKPRS